MSHYKILKRFTDAVIYEGEAESLNVLVNTAVKSKADLSSADLSSANLSSHIFSFSGIGSAKRITSYFVEADKIWCGCFYGALAEFESQVLETHGKNPQYLAEYMAGIQFLKSCVEAIPKDELEKSRAEYAEVILKAEVAK